MPSTLNLPQNGDVNPGGSIITMYTIQCLVSLLVVALRFWSRWQKSVKFGLDDWAMLGQWVTALKILTFRIV